MENTANNIESTNTPVPSLYEDFSSHSPDSSRQLDETADPAYYQSCTPLVHSVNSLISPASQNSDVGSTMKRKSTYKKDCGKKRQRHKDQWIDVKRKRLLNAGQEYINRAGKLVEKRKMRSICANTCKLKCNNKFCLEVRKNIFQKFWELGDHGKRWEYILKFSKKHKKARVTTEGDSRRQYTTKYFLPLPFENTYQSTQVCLKTFINTLAISDRYIRTAYEKLDQEGSVGSDNRGKHGNHHVKIDEEVKQSVINHVSSFQPVESHYIRKDSSKIYLDNELSFSRMFNMYKTWSVLNNYSKTAQTLRQYRDIINSNMNVGFFMPKKDLCDICQSFKNETLPSEDQKEVYNTHITNKNSARVLKTSDKVHAISRSPKVVTASFDFQKILNVPHGDVGLYYYKRKLSLYNFSIFDMAELEGICYMWTENTAKRGANEVSSCLSMFIQDRVKKGANEFRFWSDNCAGQNRNRIVFSAYMLLSKQFNVDITHRFLEKGHTQNESDSVHALIERQSKGKLIYTPDQWYALVRWAKTSAKPYNVIEVTQDDVYDFKTLLVNRNWKKNTLNENIKWNKVKEIRIKKENHNTIFIKYEFHEDYCRLNTIVETRRTRNLTSSDTQLPRLYSDHLPVTKSKYEDLQYLCNSGLIPKPYHNFYSQLTYDSINNSTQEEEDE